MPTPIINPTERFLRHSVKQISGCIEWQSTRQKSGYGKFKIYGKTLSAHRFAYATFVGPIPDGMCVLHRCDNPPCVNPEHLFLGTKGDNNKDRDRKHRHRVTKGEESVLAVLSESDIRLIRTRYKSGELQKVIAKDFGVSRKHVSDIVNRKRWKHVDAP